MIKKSIVSSALIAAGLLLAALITVPARGAEKVAEKYKVIVHRSNPATTLPRELVARYFLKKTTEWPSGKAITVVDQTKDSAVRATFAQEVLKKTLAEVSAYWQQQVFSGAAVPPVEKKGDAAVVALVETTETAIGYVQADAIVGAAKVVEIE